MFRVARFDGIKLRYVILSASKVLSRIMSAQGDAK